MPLISTAQILAMQRLRNALSTAPPSKQKKPSGIFGQNSSTASDANKGYKLGARIARGSNPGAVDSQFANEFPELANSEATSMLGAADTGAGLDSALASGSNLGALDSLGADAGSDLSYYMPDLASEGASIGSDAAASTGAATGADAAGAAAGGGFGALATGGLIGAGILGTQLGRDYFSKKYGDKGQAGWAAANVLNPINTALEAPDIYKNITSGKKLNTAQELATASLTGGSSFLYNPVMDVLHGDKLNTKERLIAGAATGGLSELYNPIAGMFGSHKGADQKSRDDYRSNLKDAGVLDDNYNLTLADGSKYDFGADGKHVLTNFDGSTRKTYEADSSNPLANQASGWANPLSAILTNGDTKQGAYLSNQLANATTSNAKSQDDVKNNIKTIFGNLGIDSTTAMTKIGDLANSGKLDMDTAHAFQNGINTLGLPTHQVDQSIPQSTQQASPAGIMNTGYQPLSAEQQQALQDQIVENSKRYLPDE